MRGADRARLSAAAAALAVVAFVAGACAGEGFGTGDSRSPAAVRAERRAYDGAPPVAPHQDFGITCVQCHNQEGMEVADVGYAPPSPHELTAGMSAMSRCRQCHVFQATTELFVDSSFVALRQDLRQGRRLNPLAPPVIPHKLLMRENCTACHAGPAAREEIRTSHPDRVRCRQCHLPQQSTAGFESAFGPQR